MSEDLLGNDVGAYLAHSIRRGYVDKMLGQFFGKAGDATNMAGAINFVYGTPVYDQVNRSTNAHAIVKKTMWDQSGHRVVSTNPATKGYGGADPGTVGAVVDVSPTELDIYPAFLHTPFDLTLKAAFQTRHDDGVDGWAWKLAIMRDVHAQLLDEQWLKDAQGAKDGATANTTDAKADTNTTAGFRGLTMESLDRLISNGQENADTTTTAFTGWYDVYQGQVDRDANPGNFDSVVVRPTGASPFYATTGFDTATPSAFSIDSLDYAIDTTQKNGADKSASVILTGYETLRKVYNVFRDLGRVDLTERNAKLTYSGLSLTATLEGRDITHVVSVYQERPFVADHNVPKETTGAAANATAPRIYVMDQRNLMIQVGFPTIYVDGGNPIYRGQFDTKALYLTAEQGKMTRFNTSAKVRDIAA